MTSSKQLESNNSISHTMTIKQCNTWMRELHTQRQKNECPSLPENNYENLANIFNTCQI